MRTRFLAALLGVAPLFEPLLAQLPKAYLADRVIGPAQATAGSGNALRDLYLLRPFGVATDRAGNVFVSDQHFHRVIKIAPDGTFSTFAGNGRYGEARTGVPATESGLAQPSSIATDAAGNLYIADRYNRRIVKVAPDGILTTVAGASSGTNDDGQPPLQTRLNPVFLLTSDSAGNLYFVEDSRYRVRKVPAGGGPIQTIAGNGTRGESGDGGPATSAQIEAWALHAEDNGTVRLANWDGPVRKVVNGVISKEMDVSPPPLASPIPRLYGQGYGIAFQGGNLYAVRTGRAPTILKCPGATACVPIVGGGGPPQHPIRPGFDGDGPARQHSISGEPRHLTVDAAGNVTFIDGHLVRRVTAQGQLVTLGGNVDPALAGHGQPSDSVRFEMAWGVAVGPDGSVYLPDSFSHRVWKVNPNGQATLVAGRGLAGFSGDGGPAAQADLWAPTVAAVDGQGNVYVADYENSVVRRITPQGVISTVAGVPDPGGTCSVSAEGPATQSCFWFFNDLAIDGSGALVMAADNDVWRVSGGAATKLGRPDSEAVRALAIDRDGRIYAATYSRVYRGTANGGPWTLIAGTGQQGVSGDGGPATAAQIDVIDIEVDPQGVLWIAGGLRLRAVTRDGVIRTISGGGAVPGTAAAGGNASSVRAYPRAVAAGPNGKIYFADTFYSSTIYTNVHAWSLEPAQIFRTSVVNAASYQGGGVAPGEMVTVFGIDIGPGTLAPYRLVGNQFQTEVAGTRVLFNGIPAPIIYASSGANAVVVPYGVASRTEAEIWVEVNGVATNKVRLPVMPTMPGVFTTAQNGAGQAALLHWPDYSTNGPSNLLRKGGVGMLYLTAGGEAGRDGWIVGGAEVHPMPVMVKVGGVTAPVSYSGPAPGLIYGMMQINFTIPPDAPSGAQVPLEVTVGTRAAQSGITIAIQ